MKNGSQKQISESAETESPNMKKIEMTGKVSPISPRSGKKMNTRMSAKKPHVPPAPSSFDALVSPQRRIRHSIAVSPKIPSYASPGQLSQFRKQSNRTRSSKVSRESAKASRQKKLETWAIEEEEESPNFQKQMQRNISAPPLGSPASPERQAASIEKNGQKMERSGSPPPPPPPLSPSEGSDGPTETRGRSSKYLPPSFRNDNISRSASRSISPPISPSSSPGRKQDSMSNIFFSSLSSSNGAGAKFRKRESLSPLPAPSFGKMASPGNLRGRKSIAITGGSVTGSGGPGAKFRERESVSPVPPSTFRNMASPGSLRGRSIAVTGGLGSLSSSVHDNPAAKNKRRESLSSRAGQPPRSFKKSASTGLSRSAHDGPVGKFQRRDSVSSAASISSAGSQRAERRVGSLRGGRSFAVFEGGLSSRENSRSPSRERRKPNSKKAYLSASDHGTEEDKFSRRGSISNSFEGMETPPSGLGRKSLGVQELKSRSAHETSRRRQSIGVTNDLSSRLSEDSFHVLATPFQRGKKSALMSDDQDIPSFATPRGQMRKGRRKWTSTYLDKPMGGPRGAVKKKERDLSPMTTHSGSYMNKSPGGFNGRMSVSGGSSISPVPTNHHAGSYMNKSPGGFNSRMSMSPGSLSRMSISKIAMVAPQTLDETPEDISIQVTIPDIEKKIKARREQKKKANEYSVPEHIRKYREREQRVRTAQEEKEYRQRELAVAMIYGWAARTRYKNMKKERDMKLLKIAKEKAMEELRSQSALKVQTRYRMYVKRKRYLYLIGCRRRREKNWKQIKKIEKRLGKIPKETANELKTMKKDLIKKKKEMKKNMKKLKVNDAEQQNQNLIEYLREENRKLKEERSSIQTDHSLLQKQFELLEKKSAEIDKRFKSLKKFVVHKNATIQKTEGVLHKCRNKYVPNHRRELSHRNLYCATEFRIKDMYKKRLGRILDEVNTVANERELRKDAKRAAREVKRELAKIPVLEIPLDLKELLEELNWTRR